MADSVLILEPGDEQAQKIAKAMSSQTANDILNFLREGQQSQTEITERLAIPLTTAQYHIENLLDAGLISVAATRYSVKGREIKYYALTNQLLIVASKRSDVRSLLLKYASLFGIVIFGSLAITLVSPLMTIQSGINTAPMQAERDAGIVAAKAAYGAAAPSFTSLPETAIAFFFGGLLVICVLLCYEAYLWKKVR
ncbi:MAG: winged helix-turn-helix domain-containing protein [Methanoregula sp.]|nr:winged helix-turn-helix domain-containing protein [Methanoregula sp.]